MWFILPFPFLIYFTSITPDKLSQSLVSFKQGTVRKIKLHGIFSNEGGINSFLHISDVPSSEMVGLTCRNKPGSHYLPRTESAFPPLRLCRIQINLKRYRWHSHSIPVSSVQIWRLILYYRPNTIKWYWTDASFHTSFLIQWVMEPSVCHRPERDTWVRVKRLRLWLWVEPRNESCGPRK